jgi:hypothetical protein
VIQASSFTASSGLKCSDDILREINNGAWARFAGLDFGQGVDALAIRMACDDARAGGVIRVRLDAADGPVLYELPVESTGGFGHFVTRIVPISGGVTGRRDVYLTFAGNYGVADVAYFQFLRQPGNPWRAQRAASASASASASPTTSPAPAAAAAAANAEPAAKPAAKSAAKRVQQPRPRLPTRRTPK